jgi:hypothetical protein
MIGAACRLSGETLGETLGEGVVMRREFVVNIESFFIESHDTYL